MDISLSKREADVVADLATEMDISEEKVMVLSLRMFQWMRLGMSQGKDVVWRDRKSGVIEDHPFAEPQPFHCVSD